MSDGVVSERKARHQVGQAIITGRLVRPGRCQKCSEEDRPMKDGRTSIQAHHHKGYDFPLEVEWLCHLCHREFTPTPYGDRAAAAKVGWECVDQIRNRYRSGEPYYRIAADLGFHPTTVHRIVTHRSWPEHARPADYATQPTILSKIDGGRDD